MPSTDFPTTIPAMQMVLEIGPPILIGSVSRGTPLTVVPITGGQLFSHESFPHNFEFALLSNGNDFIHNDPSGHHMRLDTRIVARSRDARDDMLYIKYKGVIEITPELSNILGGNAHSRTTQFGASTIQVEFETGCERYRFLETNIFVGAGRFVVDETIGRVHVEYCISQVVSGTSSGKKDVVTQTQEGPSVSKVGSI